MTAEPIEHRAAKVAVVNALSTAFSVGFQLVSVPVCLRFWGKENYGTWLSLFSAFMLLRGLDGGFTAFVGNKLNYLYHKDTATLRVHLASAIFGIAVISVLQLALSAGTLGVDALSEFLGMPAERAAGTAAKLGLVTLMMSWVLTGSYLGIVHRLLIPAGFMYQSAWWAMAFQVGQFAAMMVSAVLSLNMLEASLCFAASQIALCVASALYVRRVLPELSPWLRKGTGRVGFRDLGNSIYLTTSNLVQQSTTNGAVLLLAALSGPLAVPVFTTTRTLTNLWNSVTTILSTPLLPDAVRMHVHGETDKLVAVNQTYWASVGAAVNIGAVASYPLIPYLYGRWTSHTVALHRPLLCFLLGSVVMANSGAFMALYLGGINRLRIGLAAMLARAFCGLGGGVLGFARYGLTSFGVGILIGEVAATSMVAVVFLREVTSRGPRVPVRDLGPVLLGTGAAVSFFVGAGFGWWSVGGVWLATIAVAGTAAIWGWNTLHPELHGRLKHLPRKLLRL